MGELVVTFHDYGVPQEASAVRFPIPDLNAGNFSAQAALITTLINALNDEVVIGVMTKEEIIASRATFEIEQPASQFAQRETKWLVRYQDATTFDRYSLEIPTANLVKLDPASNERADLTEAKMAAFKDAFEALVKQNGHAVTVIDILFVSRNL
jgi:hypothetical protein